MKRYRSLSVSKLNENTLCEDASLSSDTIIAISDGAGGGGLFAERWSKYLLDNLPKMPIESAELLDQWVGSIWEPFYAQCESDAKRMGGLTLRKFYEEGSFATLAVAWIDGKLARWITYGDSVVFHYNIRNDELRWSHMTLAKFNESPYLIGTTSALSETGFNTGIFCLDSDSVVFAASDALSHYIIMMYELRHHSIYDLEIQQAIDYQQKNSKIVQTARLSYNARYKNHVMKVISSSGNKANFIRHLSALLRRGVILNDDFSFAYIFPEESIVEFK